MEIVMQFPDMNLGGNKIKGRAWYVNRKYSIKAREVGFWTTIEQIQCPLKFRKVRVLYTIHQPDNRVRNQDNIITALKSYQDGIADAIKIPDERMITNYNFEVPVIKGGRVVVTLTEMVE